jgi:glycosyltransferase involved in cell wall biosynthesis
MKLSVVVPSYGRPDSLRSCLAAILSGNRAPDELVAVVRETDAASQALVDELAAHDGRGILRRVLVEEPGQIAAINQGLRTISGDIVCLTDDDTVPSAHWLERLEACYGDEAVVGVGGRDRIPDSPDREPADRVGVVTWYGAIIGNHHRGCAGIRRVDHLKGANMSFRRSALPAFDPNLFRAASMLNDTDASLGARRHGILLYDPEAVVDHYPAERGAGVTRDIDDPEVVRADSHNWAYCMLKHLPWWGKAAFLVYALLVGQGSRLGILKWLQACLRRRPNAWRQFRASTRGKLQGLQTYLRTRGGRQPAATRAEVKDGP